MLGNLQHHEILGSEETSPIFRCAPWVWECHDTTPPRQMQTPGPEYGARAHLGGFLLSPSVGQGEPHTVVAPLRAASTQMGYK